MAKLVQEITAAGNWLAFPKTIALQIGLHETLLLMEHVTLSDNLGRNQDGWYYRTRSSLANVLGVSNNTCKKYEQKLIDLRLLKCKVSTDGVSANWFKVNTIRIKRLLNTKDTVKNSTPSNTTPPQNLRGNKNTNIDDTTYHHGHSKKVSNGSKRVNKRLTPVVTGNAPTPTTSLKRRKVPLSTRSKFKGLSKDGNPRDAAKRALVKLHPDTVELLLYWNSLPFVQKHNLVYNGKELAQLDKQSKTVQHVDEVLQQVLKGKLYKDCADITEVRFKKMKPRLPGIKMALKRYSESLNPDCNYAVSGKKIPLYKFFCFRQMEVNADKGRKKYILKYPFLYYLGSEAIPLKEERKPIATKQPILLAKIINEFKANGITNITGPRYNDVVKATNIIDEIITRRLQTPSKRRNAIDGVIPMLFNSMRSSYGGVKLEFLFKTCSYKLEDYMSQKRYL